MENKMENKIITKSTIDDDIKQVKKAIAHNRKLYSKYLSESISLREDLFFLVELRQKFFPEQYTKSGFLRKRYKDNV